MTYSETFSLALGSSQTGLTLKAALVATDGTIDGSARDISTGFTEIGVGNYIWYYASFADGFIGGVVFYVGTLGVATDFTGVTVKAQSTAGVNPDHIKAQADQALLDYDGPTNTEMNTAFSEIKGSGWSSTTDTLELIASGGPSNTYPTVQRDVADLTSIRFDWPDAAATITVTRSIDGGAFGASTGTASYLRDEGSLHIFTLSQDSADRPASEAKGYVVYKLDDGTTTRYLRVRLVDDSPDSDEIASATRTELSTELSQLSSVYISTRGGITVNVSSPVASDGSTLNLIHGDDYLQTDGREITWTGDTADQWPDLTSGTLLFAIDRTNSSGLATISSPSGTQSFYVELDKDKTSIPQGTYKYDVQATLNNGSVVTLVRGNVNIDKSYTN